MKREGWEERERGEGGEGQGRTCGEEFRGRSCKGEKLGQGGREMGRQAGREGQQGPCQLGEVWNGNVSAIWHPHMNPTLHFHSQSAAQAVSLPLRPAAPQPLAHQPERPVGRPRAPMHVHITILLLPPPLVALLGVVLGGAGWGWLGGLTGAGVDWVIEGFIEARVPGGGPSAGGGGGRGSEGEGAWVGEGAAS